MGNCQAIDAAALVIQHPCGKIERLYWAISASEVMRLNPGHYVSLIIPLPGPAGEDGKKDGVNEDGQVKTVRFTRVKLLRPAETLALGHAYRLVTTQEVIKVLKAKKYAKKQRAGSDGGGSDSSDDAEIDYRRRSSSGRLERDNSEKSASHGAKSVTRSKSWRPSLQSISEATA